MAGVCTLTVLASYLWARDRVDPAVFVLSIRAALPCPSHSHYTACAPLCPATCNDIFAPTLCEKPGECTEGCVCNNGYVLSNDRCVPLRDCGCRDNKDNYYSVSGFGPKRLPGFAALSSSRRLGPLPTLTQEKQTGSEQQSR